MTEEEMIAAIRVRNDEAQMWRRERDDLLVRAERAEEFALCVAAQDRLRGYPTGSEWMKIVRGAQNVVGAVLAAIPKEGT